LPLGENIAFLVDGHVSEGLPSPWLAATSTGSFLHYRRVGHGAVTSPHM